MKRYAIGTDIGGSHISCALVSLLEKKLVKDSIRSQQVNNQAPAEEILDNWCIALQKTKELVSEDELAGIGFAIPGPFDYANGIALFTHEVAKYEKLYGVDIADELAKRLEMSAAKFRFMNDATAFAVGEAWAGKAKNVTRSLSVTLGTGFGSAFIDEGLPVVERTDVPRLGCVWHLPYRNGIADDYFSTRWFTKRYHEETGHMVSGVKAIADNAADNPVAKKTFVEFGTNLGDFLGPWLKKFEAEMLVIGGNVSGAYQWIEEAFSVSLKKQDIYMPVEISELMENSAIAGSAHMFDETFWGHVKPMLSKM
ncbi:MAG: ROK family protein [Bacteroidales bacterium]|nr:ROK family protein [Bacteroidales bacterium]